MKQILLFRSFPFWFLFALIGAKDFITPLTAPADVHLLKAIVIAHNQEVLKESLINDSHRGEEGILRIRPEIGKFLGMRVYMDQDYVDAKALFERADAFLEEAKIAMSSEEEEKYPEEHVQKIAQYFISHKQSVQLAKEKLVAYRSRINSRVDERLNDAISAEVTFRLLQECLEKTDYRLRDALGLFFNICQDKDQDSASLTPENVTFVNLVFEGFINRASEEALSRYDLDRDGGHHQKASYDWKNALGDKASEYITLYEAVFKKFKNKIYNIDPLLFFALMRRESRFDPLAVSPMGAVGLTQIMPKTGKDLGMTNIYVPAYYGKAVSLIKQERRAKEEAMAALSEITDENRISPARRARELMQKSLRLGKRREQLFARYKRELLQKRTDDRLKPDLAIEFGLTYFARQMRAQNGDMSLALSSYNAGPNSVHRYKGIPPYEETVFFRNRVLQYYRDYQRKALGSNWDNRINVGF